MNARIVDEIRDLLLSYDQSMRDSLVGLARDYAEACVEANKRLSKCQWLLQQGLRVEALRLAREAPDLLDSIQALDFPERGAWTELVKEYGLAIPPEFDAVAIEFVQSAYVEDDSLKELLREHRRLALILAPLRQRIDVLRELAAKDPNNPVWGADIQALELARVEQIKQEAAEARRRQDVAGLGLLNDELSAKGWLIPLPESIIREVSQALAQFRQNQGQQDMAGLVFSLHEAFAALDVDAARQIRARWRQIEGKSGMSAETPFSKQVEPVFQWLDEIDRQEAEESDYHLTLADLDRGLGEGLRRPELVQLYDEIVRYGRRVPDDIEARYRARIADLDPASSWITKMFSTKKHPTTVTDELTSALASMNKSVRIGRATASIGRLIRSMAMRGGAAKRIFDAVDCTVFAPPDVHPGDPFIIQVYTHTDEQAAAAARLAVIFDKDTRPRGCKSLEVEIERGARLLFYLDLPGMNLEDPVQKLIWRGQPQAVQFRVGVPIDHSLGDVLGNVSICLDSVPVGYINFKLTVVAAGQLTSSRKQPVGTVAHRFRRAFISYASKDRVEVLKRVQMLNHAGIKYFQDVLSLEPGDRWELQLFRHIDRCDLFLLFWSTAAKQSKWVMKEVGYALRLQGGNPSAIPQIRPVIIEGPPTPTPPEELAALHFNDKIIYMMINTTGLADD